MCKNLRFDYQNGSQIWEPKSTVLQKYQEIQDSPFFVAESDNEDYHQGLYTGDGQTIKKVLFSLRMDHSDLDSLYQFRRASRSSEFEAFIGRIDPFMDGNFDTTHTVRILDIERPTRDSVNYYTLKIGLVK